MFSSDGVSQAESSTGGGGGKFPHAPLPLEVATGCAELCLAELCLTMFNWVESGFKLLTSPVKFTNTIVTRFPIPSPKTVMQM